MHRGLTADHRTHLRVLAEMARCAAMHPARTSATAAAVTAAVAAAAMVLASHDARADERLPPAAAAGAAGAASAANGRFALDLGGVRQGFVRATLEPDKSAPSQQRLILTAQDVAPSLASLVETFAQGKPVKRDVRLTSGAVVRKANDGRLVSAKLPAIGSGGVAEIELGLAVSSLTTQPLLSAKEAPASPSSARITGFRVELTGMQAIEAPKLDPITITQRPDGAATTGEIAIEVAAGGAPPFVAWQKSGGGRPVPRTLRVEYVGVEGAVILKLQLERCTPSSVTPRGASGTTRITLTCATSRGG
jgi:hypothetical protein